MFKKEKENQQENQCYKYWMNCVQRAKKKRPITDWKKAERRLTAYQHPDSTVDERPFVNDFRKLYESSMSFLDQQSPSFKVSPEEAFMNEIDAQKASECDALFLKKIWREQKCQKSESLKLSSALIRNVGFTMPYFDVKKWLPSIRYIPADKVFLDPDCGGIIEDANWIGYEEDVPVEEFRSWHPEIDDKKFKAIVKKGGSVLTEDEHQSLPEDQQQLYSTVKIYHIYARNASAITSMKEGDVPKKGLAEELQLDTPRKYYQFVAGWNEPIVDEDQWPYDLDHDEFPITMLQFNRVPESLYGFTDYSQMERLDEISDEVVNDIGMSAFAASITKYLGRTNATVDPVMVHDFLNNMVESYLPDMLDAEGQPKMVPIQRGQVDQNLMSAYQLLHDQSKEASGQNELLENADAATFKDVTAIAARIADANQHQRINRRLGGPNGYEASIAEDAIKMLEIAHQFVPPLSQVAVLERRNVLNEMGTPIIDEMGQPVEQEEEVLQELPWPQALQAIKAGGTLIKLGVDAIVGPELAQYWSYGMASEHWRLSAKVVVEPGSTRDVTRDQRAAVLKQLYLEVFMPFYQQTGRIDLARGFIEMIGRMSDVPNIENLLPGMDEMIQQRQMMEMMQMGQPGGQPLNTPEANGGEMQEEM